MKHKYNKLFDFNPHLCSTALVRASLDLPTDEHGNISDTKRLLSVLPTLEYLQEAGTRIILIGHRSTAQMSLKPVSDILQKYIPHKFIPSLRSPSVSEYIKHMNDGDLLMLENLRIEEGEKANEEDLARLLASRADFFVFEDFPVAHREHASVVSIPKFLPSYAGKYFDYAVQELEKIDHHHENSVAIFGGAKTETKLAIIEGLLDSFDKIHTGGVIANSLLKARGYNIGRSLYGDLMLDSHLQNNEKIITPKDVYVLRYNKNIVVDIDDVKDVDFITDIGPKTLKAMAKDIFTADYVVCNGPVGYYDGGYKAGSLGIGRAIQMTNAKTLIGGGDLLASMGTTFTKENIVTLDGGGAFLFYLQKHTLPALKALEA